MKLINCTVTPHSPAFRRLSKRFVVLDIAESGQYESRRRRIYTEEKGKVVAAVWGTYLNAALAK